MSILMKQKKRKNEMKIVFVVPDMAGGGTEHVIALLANEYVKRGIGVSILSFAGTQQAYALDKRVETVSAGIPSRGNWKTRLKRLAFMRDYFKKNKGCFIFSFSTYGTGFIVLSTLGLGRRMLVSERTDPRSCDHKLYRNFFYRFADCLVCQTQGAIECFPKYLQKKACVIGNPIADTLPERYTGARRKSVVSVGRLEPVKNHRMLIRAFAKFSETYSDYLLEIYGEGSLCDELKEFTETLGIESKVIFHGFCKNVMQEIRDSSMFVLSSDYEGLSNSMIEAMAMGVPVIATDCPIGGSRTYIQDGYNGLLVPVGDAEAMCSAMLKLADNSENSEYYDNISKNSEKIRNNMKCEIIADKFIELCEN